MRARQQTVRELERSVEEYDDGDLNGLEAQRSRIAMLQEELARLTEQGQRPFVAKDTIVCDIREAVVS